MQIKSAVLATLLLSGPANAQLADLFSNTDTLVDRLGSVVGCDLSARLKADMPVASLYSDATGACELQRPVDSGRFYSDAECSVPVDFYRTGQQQFCDESVDKQQLGNGASVRSGWTLSPGTRYDIGVQSLEGLVQPYRESVSYRTIETSAGECQLEMRIYKSSLAENSPQPAIPLLAIHGGSWKARGFGTMGIESAAAHYTAKGFVVFAPFYRLLSDSEPNTECQSTPISEIVGDADAALQWVIDNAARYGAAGKPAVMGQSAGAHLALSAAFNRSAQVSSLLLMYPPTDFANFIQLVLDGEYANEQGLRILADVLGETDAARADVSLTPIPENSFPTRLADRNGEFPPTILFHGLADELVPASQSVRLCNALAGRPVDEVLITDGTLEQVVECGATSRLHLYQFANHALDICLTGNELLGAACPAGGRDSQRLIAAAFDRATDDLAASTLSSVGTGGSSGGGVFYPSLSLILLTVCKRFRALCEAGARS